MRIKEMLPILITVGNIVCGFVSMLCVTNHNFVIAAWLIIAAMALDTFDGRLARLMKSTSKTGAQLDSMADLITFGVAPAMLMVMACSHFSPAMVWCSGLLFVICAAFRLARFNVQKEDGTNIPCHFFSGLPSTLSGGTVAQLVILNHFLQIKFGITVIIDMLPFITIALGLFMISKVPFFNITSKIGIKQGVGTMILEFSAATLFFVITPQLALSSALSFYLIICALYGFVKGKELRGEYSTT